MAGVGEIFADIVEASAERGCQQRRPRSTRPGHYRACDEPRRCPEAAQRLRGGALTVTEVCFAVGSSSLGTFSTRFTELVGMPPSRYRAQAVEGMLELPSCVAKQVTRPIRNREAQAPSRA